MSSRQKKTSGSSGPRPLADDVPRAQVMRRDYFSLRREQDLQRRSAAVARSEAIRKQRHEARAGLNLTVAENLPVADHADEIRTLLHDHQVVVVAGETGSGKTTQLPKICMQLGFGVGGMIAHTQPRRLAARTVAKRISEETQADLGNQVGYAVRFADQVSEQTLLKVMTDGLLLTEIRSDRFLDAYDVVIIDEAHERSLNIDFLLGYLKRLLRKRKDLKVIVTSATIDVQRFSKFFDDAPVVSVSGRTFPVEVRYLEADQEAQDTNESIVQVLRDIERHGSSQARDVLVFFAGEREIFEAAKLLRQTFKDQLEVLPLYARLSFAEQKKIFEPGGHKRRVVLSTNVAETSLTVPNIGYVIDPGFARINRYSYRSKLQRLPIEPISQASADQRKGRCGRIAPGICYRLYAQQDYLSRPEFSDAEIHRVNLASVVLQMLAFKLGDISKFPFIDLPDGRAIKDATRLLEELQALEFGKLTKLGQQMARMPLDPRLARMLLAAGQQGALREVLSIVSALAAQDPRERPLNKAQAADQAHAAFADERSDFMSLVVLWQWLEEQRQQLTRGRFEKLLRKQFLNVARVREWRELHRQLRLSAREIGLSENSTPAHYQAIHESILAGSLSLIGQHDERGVYLGARNLKLRIFPGSSLAKRTPKWIVAGEIAETSRIYARQVASVEPAWIERQGEHLLKTQYSEPFWSIRRGEAMAYKRVSLYGLLLAERKEVRFAPIDAAHARDLFIREGLVQGGIKHKPDFLVHNLREVAQIEELEAKGRRRDLLVSEDEIYAFYADRLPTTMVSLTDLNRWLKRSSGERHESLMLSAEDLLQQHDAGLTVDLFPNEVSINSFQFAVHYRFAPGEIDDGVNVDVPVGLLAGVGAEPFEWSVPGFLPNVVDQWLRSLPKSKRRNLVPLPDTVEELSQWLTAPEHFRKGRLLAALARLLKDRFSLEVVESDWHRERVATHLLANVRILDENGKLLGQGRDIRELKEKFSATSATSGAANIAQAELQNIDTLPDGYLAEHKIIGRNAAPVIKYPGLVDRGESVDLRLFDDEQARDNAHRRGLCRLALSKLGKVGSYFRRELDKHKQIGLHFAPLGNAQELKDELLLNTLWYCFFEGRPLPVNDTELSATLTANKGRLGDMFDKVVGQFAYILARRFEITRQLEGLSSKAYEASVADIQAQLAALVPRDVLAITPYDYLLQLPRYLAGITRRIETLPGHVPKDLKLINEIRPLLQRFEALQEAELAIPERMEALKFYLEELRLQLFAESISRQKVSDHPLDHSFLGERWKVSSKRVDATLRAEEQRVGLA
ncbi:MAG: ATP-dependent RNA helicase HrpA [Pseudomonadaceae bacterium]|nr:ATP-dependent RNA helicase HrpA [Pseudomonadaceae bacterium]